LIPGSGIVTGLLVGVLFGFFLQRGRFCMNSAFRDLLVFKDYTLAKAVVVALVVELIGFHAMASLGIIRLNPKPFFWAANIIGGFIFGVGMVLAGGCASGTSYRVGEGMMGSFMALLGYAMFSVITACGALKPVKDYLQSTTKITIENPCSLVSESARNTPTLASLLGVNPWILVIVISVIAIAVLAWKGRGTYSLEKPSSLYERVFKQGWGWLAVGIAIGVVNMLAFPASAAAGRNYPLGITGGWATLTRYLVSGDVKFLNWETFEVVGLVIGAFIAAAIAGEFKLRSPGAKRLVQQYIGGALMGIGAVINKGCNIGHILSGVPQLAVSSWLGGFFIIIGCWTAAYFMFMRE